MKNCFYFFLIIAFLGGVAIAEAQQPTKVPRIGFLVANSPSVYTARIEAFRQGLVSLDTWREKTLSLSGDPRRAI